MSRARILQFKPMATSSSRTTGTSDPDHGAAGEIHRQQPTIPAGKYWIVDRPAGGIRSQTETWIKDAANALIGKPSRHDEWFALYRDDGQIDDWTWINGMKRGNFRLHPAGGRGASLGCITLPSYADFQRIRHALLHTTTIPARNSGLNAYGWIEVIANGNTCP